LPSASAGQSGATQIAQAPVATTQQATAQAQRPATRPIDRFAVISAQRALTDAELDRVWGGL
jgi:hypothetical protein